MNFDKRRAISPVIATVILIAVAVALGIAVAFWASGLTGSFSKYEKLGVNTQYAIGVSPVAAADCNSAVVCWKLNLAGQNTGSSDSTVIAFQVNGVPYTVLATANWVATQSINGAAATALPLGSTQAISVKSGQSFAFVLELDAGGAPVVPKTFAHGQTIQVVIVTATGNNYPASVVLP
jgi:flagellin-like protein